MPRQNFTVTPPPFWGSLFHLQASKWTQPRSRHSQIAFWGFSTFTTVLFGMEALVGGGKTPIFSLDWPKETQILKVCQKTQLNTLVIVLGASLSPRFQERQAWRPLPAVYHSLRYTPVETILLPHCLVATTQLEVENAVLQSIEQELGQAMSHLGYSSYQTV